ncbi:C1 family peptidase [Herbaspirillum frisingense]|uniref:C1 family peptidase n=1 Tax=Herbaspirillum frisingense TaxID=92645 RepID=UPI0039AFEA3D
MINPIVNFSAACGTARDQFGRGTCLAFASSDFNQHANGSNDALSIDYLAHHAAKQIKGWKAGDGLTMSSAIGALHVPGQPPEVQYAYDPNDHARPLAVVPTVAGPLLTSKVTKRRLNPALIHDTLKAGKLVCLALALSDKFFSPKGGIVEYATDYVPDAAHAVVAVGLGTHISTNDLHVLIRNSWGVTWGNSGHAWLPTQYLETHLIDSFAL